MRSWGTVEGDVDEGNVSTDIGWIGCQFQPAAMRRGRCWLEVLTAAAHQLVMIFASRHGDSVENRFKFENPMEELCVNLCVNRNNRYFNDRRRKIVNTQSIMD